MSENDLKPVAKGSFSKTPFSHILIYLWEQQKGGTLLVSQGEHKVEVYFQEGTPAKVRSNVGKRDLTTVLHNLGLIDDAQRKAATDVYKEKGGLQGQILVRQGAVNPPTLIRGLREQMLLKLTDIFAMTKARYAFYDKVNLIVGFGPDELFPLDPFPVLMAGMRVHGHRRSIAEVCDTLKGKWVSAKDPENIRRFRLNKDEKMILEEMLAGPCAYDDFINSPKFNPKIIQYIIYALMITKLITVADQGPQDEAEGNTKKKKSKLDSINPVPRENSTNPEIVAKRQRILDKATAIPTQNYYEMLELPYGAPHEEVRTAFFRMAKIFHPDKVQKEMAVELKDTLQYIFSNLTEAHATLIDPDSREEYEAAIKTSVQRTSVIPESNGEEDEVRRVLHAENDFQKALVFLKRDQLDKAKTFIDKAIANNPQEAEYQAVWAHVEGRRRPLNEDVEDLVNSLRQAVESHPKSERINLFLAQILKRAGREVEARHFFSKVVNLNPQNIEAAREIRLMDMRRKSEANRPSGIFKKLFKG